MRIRFASFSACLLLAACSASPTSPAAAADGAPQQSQYVGPGSTGDQKP